MHLKMKVAGAIHSLAISRPATLAQEFEEKAPESQEDPEGAPDPENAGPPEEDQEEAEQAMAEMVESLMEAFEKKWEPAVENLQNAADVRGKQL